MTSLAAPTMSSSAAPEPSRGRARFASIVVAATFVLIAFGGQVTTTLAGDSVPTWPASFFIPNNIHQFYELHHRWIAAPVGFAVAGLCFWVLASEKRRGVRRLAIAAVVLVVVQALVGGRRVLLGETHHNAWPIAHALLAQAFLATVVALATLLSPKWLSATPPVISAETLDMRRRARWFVLAVYLQAFLGAILRHESQNRDMIGLVAHLVGAVLVLVLAMRLSTSVAQTYAEEPLLRKPAVALGMLILGQLILGLSAWLTTHGQDGYVNPQDATSLFPTLHLVTGAAILAVGMLLLLRTYRFLTPAR